MHDDIRQIIMESAVELAGKAECAHVFLFLDNALDVRWFEKAEISGRDSIVVILPRPLEWEAERPLAGAVVRSWSGNQSRFSRIKYAFLQAVLDGVIRPDERIVCVLGPWQKSRLDTVTVHDLSQSWSEEFPFYAESLIESGFFATIMAVVDIALDIGAMGREGKPVGTIFVIGDTEAVLAHSHQAVFNPFRSYEKDERKIARPEVVESLKELAKLDGAIIITADGVVEAAGRHLDTGGGSTELAPGLGARHRAGSGISFTTKAVSLVVSESSGKVSIFQGGRSVATLEPLISRRLV